MSTRRILVLGGGFAGLWSAVGAARKLDEVGQGPDAIEVTLVNRDAFHSIRVRNYEADLTSVRVPLDDVLGPIGVRRVEGEVADIDLAAHLVTVRTADGLQTISYDRLVYALGNELFRPHIPGLKEHAFDVDTYDGAAKLAAHLQALPGRPDSPGQYTVIVAGAGLTEIETACEMPRRLRAILARTHGARPFRVILADHSPFVGSDMGDSARSVIVEALAALESRDAVGDRNRLDQPGGDHAGVRRGNCRGHGDLVCGHARETHCTRCIPAEPDRFGRIPVDEFMRVTGSGGHVRGRRRRLGADGRHARVGHVVPAGRPMGRFAGHNVVCDLLNLPMLSLRIDWYTTILDLGQWGSVYTEGWDRHVVARGETAKRTKQLINCHRIYPPLTRNRREILAAAAPVVQSPPKIFH